MGRMKRRWAADAETLARKVWTGADSRIKTWVKILQNRYGPRYSAAMSAAGFISMFSPLPGTCLLTVSLVAAVAEFHRAMSWRGNFHEISDGEIIMSIKCDVFIRWGATPQQLQALGTALWRWYIRAAGHTSMYQYLDSQPLADLISGKFPVPSQALQHVERGYHLSMQDTVSHDHLTAIDLLRREIPGEGIEDILVNGASWTLTDQYTIPRSTNHDKVIGNIGTNGEKQACESQTGPLSSL